MGNIGSILKSILGLGAADPMSNLSPQEAFQRIKGQNPPQLVDVRSSAENRQGRIAGSKLIPLQELGSRLGELDPQKPLILYCQSGGRSGMALRLVKGRGFAQAAHIQGGFMTWRGMGLPVETR
jgi:rhodanese-related sulfurtransferase